MGDQDLRQRLPAGECGLIERGEPALIPRLGIGAERQQRPQRGRLSLDDGQVQRGPAPVRAIHDARERRRIRGGRRVEGVDVADGGGREQVMAGASRQQEREDLRLHGHVVPARGPPDHLELVAVAGADRIGAVIEEQPDDRQVLVLGREMQRVRDVAFVADVGIGAAFEQQSDDRLVGDAEVQRGPESGVAGQRAALAHQLGMRVEQGGQLDDVAGVGRREDAWSGDSPAPRRAPRVRRVRDRRGCGRLEPGPAREAEFAGQRMLDMAQAGIGRRARVGAQQPRPRLRIAGAQGLQPLLRFAFELIECGRGREARLMDTFLPEGLMSARSRLEEGSMVR